MKHVLVIRLSALGDVAIMAPLVEMYAATNADIRFTVAGPPLLQPLFEGMPNVEYLGLKKKQSSAKIYRALQAVGADTVIDLHHVNRVGRALFMLRLRHLLDFRFHIYSLRKGRLSRWLFIHHLKTAPRKAQFDRYDEVFSRAGFAPVHVDVDCRYVPVEPTGEVRVGIAPFAQHKGKIWPLDRMQQLVGMLADKGYKVVLFGSTDEAPVLEGWARDERVVSVAGKQSFRDELGIIKSLTLMVSMDSANMHFASALGVPVVSIWGATHPDFGFYGYRQNPGSALCAKMPCQPCSAYGKKPCRYGDYRCLRAITPQMVFGKIEALLSAAQA